MRISDWSSDVCSSDLDRPRAFQAGVGQQHQELLAAGTPEQVEVAQRIATGVRDPRQHQVAAGMAVAVVDRLERSEEHTSELQSLMSTSYAVFRLQIKNNIL